MYSITYELKKSARQMQEYGSGVSNKTGEYRDGGSDASRDRSTPLQGDVYQSSQHQFAVIQQKNYGCSNKEIADQNMATYCRVATGIYEATTYNPQYTSTRYDNSTAPTFCSPPHSPLVGLVFDPSSNNYSGPGLIGDRSINPDRRSQSTWSINNQEPIGTGAKKKIVKNQDKRNIYGGMPRYQDRSKESSSKSDQQRKHDRNLNSESTSSFDFLVEVERMVTELCNAPDSNTRSESNNQRQSPKSVCPDEEQNKVTGSSEVLLTALDKILIHDQIPNQIVQLAIEACSDAENIAIAHHNRPCFKNIHSICAKTRSNVQKPDSAVANLHSQGVPWVIKNFIFSFVRILDGWKGVKELLSEKHDTFSRIENKYYSPNIRECFVQWQAVTKEMLTHIYKTFKCLNHGFTMEQKSFTHNYYATNSAAPRHQNQTKFQAVKPQASTPRSINSLQPYNAVQPPWIQNQTQTSPQSFSEGPWPTRSVAYKKFPVVPPPNSHNFYPLNEQNDIDNNFPKAQYINKCEPCNIREAKPRQSWTISNISDFRTLDSMGHTDQRELYAQLKHKMDAELCKVPGQSVVGGMPCDLLQRRDMEIKAKMIPLSHVEKTLIPSMATGNDSRGCYIPKNNSCGDTKEEADFFEAWGQMVQKEPSDFITHHTHSIPIVPNVVTNSNNISGPVQFIDPDNDEFHEISKVYMKPGSYKVPIKPAEPVSSFPPVPNSSNESTFETSMLDDMSSVTKLKMPLTSVTLAPQPKYNLESWPCLLPHRGDNMFTDEQKIMKHTPCLDTRTSGSLDLTNPTSDRAWEAAKQSAPKFMDSIHEGSKSDTARLYDALGLGTCDEYSDDMKQLRFGLEQSDTWSNLSNNNYLTKDVHSLWDSQTTRTDNILPPNQIQSVFNVDIPKCLENEFIAIDIVDKLDVLGIKSADAKNNPHCANFDQSGNYVRDGSQKPNIKSKVAVSGVWYHPKKRKPLPNGIVKKFENIINNLSKLPEANFIQRDMDIKVAPRFYEVVRYPMCLNDISTKLKNSSYNENDQVVEDFRCIFNNVRLYLKSFNDLNMKNNVNKVSAEFEKLLKEEFNNSEAKQTKQCENTNVVNKTTKNDESNCDCDKAHDENVEKIKKDENEHGNISGEDLK